MIEYDNDNDDSYDYNNNDDSSYSKMTAKYKWFYEKLKKGLMIVCDYLNNIIQCIWSYYIFICHDNDNVVKWWQLWWQC